MFILNSNSDTTITRWNLDLFYKRVPRFCGTNLSTFKMSYLSSYLRYRKIPKISPGAYIFHPPFMRSLFLEGLYSEGLIYRGKFAVSLIVRSKIYRFCFVLLCIWGQFSKYKPPAGLQLGRGVGGMRFSGGFFASSVLGAYIWRGLFLEFYGINKIFLSFQVPLNSSF